jgi:release factor glutamine methyltransferase
MEVKDLSSKKTHSIKELEDENLSYSLVKEMESSFLEGVPFQYLLEESEFYHHRFYVNRSVLIPRPETEYLVDLVVREFKGKVKSVLDVGTGSGVILLSLLSHGVGQSGIGVDISNAALEVANINLQKLNLQSKARLLHSDRLQNIDGVFDLIISNPPYIKAQSHKNLVHSSVDKFEPQEALYLPDDFYAFWFEDFFQEIRSHLKGTFFMEGHELEVENQAKMLVRMGFSGVEVLKDLSGTPRYIRANYS